MDLREEIISFIRMRGPSLPVEVSKHIKKDLLITSAMLAELTSSKRLIISNLKVGQSKLYYLPGHENRLQNFSQYLNEKDRQTYEELRKNLVIRDSSATPLIRVSLRQLKDFARPLEVNHQGRIEMFWKWYLLANDEAEKRIKEILGIKEKESPEKGMLEDSDLQTTKGMAEQDYKEKDNGANPTSIPVSKTEGIQKPEKRPEIILEDKRKTGKQGSSTPAKTEEKCKKDNQNLLEIDIEDPFGKKVKSHLEKKGISVKSFKLIKKKTEIDMEVTIPSPAGNLLYYCKAKSKKRISEGDVATAILAGQMRKLPILFVTDGEVNRKTHEKLTKEYSSITIMRI